MKKVSLTTKPMLIKEDGVNKLIIHIFFPIEKKDEDYIKIVLLNRLLSVQSKKYNTPEKSKKAQDDLYILGYSVDRKATENYRYLSFNLTVPRIGIIDEFSLDKAIEYLYEMIFNPHTNEDSFDEEFFNHEKEFMLNRESEFPRDINEFAYDEFSKFIDPDGDYFITHDSYIKQLEEVTAKDVYDFYKRIIVTNNYCSFITGAIDNEDEILNTFNKYFKQDYKELSYDLEFFHIQPVKDYAEKTIDTEYNQSILFMHYAIKDYKEEEYLKMLLLSWIINSKENNLVYHKLRTDYKLVYDYSYERNERLGTFDLVMYVSYKDIDMARSVFNEVLDIVKDEKVFNECKNRTITSIKYDLLYMQDNPFNKTNELLNEIFDYRKLLKDEIKDIEAITYDEIMDLISRVVNEKVMIIKGGDSHE